LKFGRASSVIVILILTGTVAGCSSVPDSVGEYEPPKFSEFCPAPKTRDAYWRTDSPSAYGLRTTDVEQLVHQARLGNLSKLHSVLVVRDGILVVEEYFRGASRDHCQLIASVTKSVVSILVGMSLERSPEQTVDTPLVVFFPEYTDEMAGAGTSEITLAHALTMSAGMDWDEYTYPHPDDRNPNTQMYRQPDPKRFILGHHLIHPPGQTWNYNSGLSVVLGATVGKMTGRSIDKFAEQELFAPLGIDRYYWFKHPDGTVFSNGDLLLTPRDLAKIGLLVLNEGEWRGRRIVSRKWIADSTRQRITSRNDFGYGFHWWRGWVVRGGREFDVLFGAGTGGQRLFIVPDLNMVVVVTAQVFGNPRGPVGATEILVDYVIPAALPARPKVQVTRPAATFLEAAVGEYVNEKAAHTVRVVRQNGTLFLKPSFFSKFELTPSGPGQFHGYWSRTGNIEVEFNTNEAGSVTGLMASFLLRRRAYRKID
jgi:CubicO group peptidase (beta-lactamase class C family)